MYTVLSPAKKMDFSPLDISIKQTKPILSSELLELVNRVRKYSEVELKQLMNISDNLAKLNKVRFKEFNTTNTANTKQAIMTFSGDVYVGLDVKTFNSKDLEFSQKPLGILSGLYGLLRPMDGIQPYRLEMGSKVDTKSGANLYDFWDNKITEIVLDNVNNTKTKILVNLASNEYFSVLNPDKMPIQIIQPVFKEIRNGKAKIISFNAKKARGLMARFIIKNKINQVEHIKEFSSENYKYDPKASNEIQWIFTKR